MKSIRSLKPYPNWDLIKRGEPGEEGYITDEVFGERWRFLTIGDPSIRTQMVNSAKSRRLIPPTEWEELVDYAILKAIVSWKGNGTGKCPLKNYTWLILRNAGIGWWKRNSTTVIDSVALDGSAYDDLHSGNTNQRTPC